MYSNEDYAKQQAVKSAYLAQQTQSAGLCEATRDTTRDTSAVEQALNRLSECIDIANAQVNELQRRLSPVLVPCPTEPVKYGSCNSTGSVCAIEERINDMVNRVASVTTQLRETREMLAI